jgi:hypothetical protein
MDEPRIVTSLLPSREEIREEYREFTTYSALQLLETQLRAKVGDFATMQFVQDPDILEATQCKPPALLMLLVAFNKILSNPNLRYLEGPSNNKDNLTIRNAQRRMCQEQLSSLTRGVNINNYAEEAELVLTAPELILSEHEKLSILKNKVRTDPELAREVDVCLLLRTARTVQEYLQELCRLFRPRPTEFYTELVNLKQQPNQTAVAFFKLIQEIGVKFWNGPPDERTLIVQIINNMSPKHKDFMLAQLRHAQSTESHLNANILSSGGVTKSVINFSTLMEWAISSDSDFKNRSAAFKAQSAQSNAAQGQWQNQQQRRNNNGRQQQGNWQNQQQQPPYFNRSNIREFNDHHDNPPARLNMISLQGMLLPVQSRDKVHASDVPAKKNYANAPVTDTKPVTRTPRNSAKSHKAQDSWKAKDAPLTRSVHVVSKTTSLSPVQSKDDVLSEPFQRANICSTKSMTGTAEIINKQTSEMEFSSVATEHSSFDKMPRFPSDISEPTIPDSEASHANADLHEVHAEKLELHDVVMSLTPGQEEHELKPQNRSGIHVEQCSEHIAATHVIEAICPSLDASMLPDAVSKHMSHSPVPLDRDTEVQHSTGLVHALFQAVQGSPLRAEVSMSGDAGQHTQSEPMQYSDPGLSTVEQQPAVSVIQTSFTLDDEEEVLQIPPEPQLNQVGAKRRPNKAEPFRPEERMPLPNPGNPFIPFANHPEAKLGSACFTISLAGLALLWKNKCMPGFIQSLGDVLNLGGEERAEEEMQAVRNVAAAARQLQSSVFPEIQPALLNEGLPMVQTESNLNMHELLAAATTPAQIVPHATATMPCVQFGFNLEHIHNAPNIVRTAHLDTGCNINLVSLRAMLRDKNWYGPNTVIHKVKPFNIQFADGRTTSSAHAVAQNARITIGPATYEVNFIVMENLSTEYMLGFPFMYEYNLSIHPQQHSMSIGVCPEDWLGDLNESGNPPAYQNVQVSFKKRVLELMIKT